MKRLLLLAGIFATAVSISASTVPSMMNYQGRLTNQVNLPLDTIIPMTFSIYEDSVSLTALWSETHGSITVRNGLFTVLLGSTTPILDTVFRTDIRWIGILVGTDIEMAPRRQFATVAYAFRAAYADSVNYVPQADGIWNLNGDDAYRNTGKVGIGTSTPAAKLDVAGAGRFKWYAEILNDGTLPPAIALINTNPNGRQYNVSSGEIPGQPGSFGIIDETAGGTPRFSIDPNGNTSIGGNSTSYRLEVLGSTKIAGPLSLTTTTGIEIAGEPGHTFNIGGATPLALQTTDGSNISFMTNNTSRMHIDASDNIWMGGRLGLGTFAPQKRLHIVDMAAVLDNGGEDFALYGASDNLEHNHYLELLNATNKATAWGLKAGGVLISDSYSYADPSKSQLIVKGEVGIGRAIPSCKLDVAGQIKAATTTDSTNTIEGRSSGSWSGVAGFNTGTGPGIYGSTSSSNPDAAGVYGTNSATTGTTRGVFGSCGSPGGVGVYGAVVSGGTGVYGVEPAGGSGFAVYSDGDAKVTGKLSVGAPSMSNILAIAQGAPSDPIADAWTTYSSRRWKTNISPVFGALDKVQRLRGVYFDWISSGQHDIGLIAEEVGEVVPEVVEFEENGEDAKSVDYARLTALLIQAMKEQQEMIAELKRQVERLSSAKTAQISE